MANQVDENCANAMQTARPFLSILLTKRSSCHGTPSFLSLLLHVLHSKPTRPPYLLLAGLLHLLHSRPAGLDQRLTGLPAITAIYITKGRSSKKRTTSSDNTRLLQAT